MLRHGRDASVRAALRSQLPRPDAADRTAPNAAAHNPPAPTKPYPASV